ncbi:hypothetical protein CFP56_042737, partial [Quercus suber]
PNQIGTHNQKKSAVTILTNTMTFRPSIAQQYWTQHLYCYSGPYNLDATKAYGGKSSARSVKAGDTHNNSNQRDNPLLMSIRPKMPTASATATAIGIKNIVIQYFVEQAIHFAL